MRVIAAICAMLLAVSCGETSPGGQPFVAATAPSNSQPADAEGVAEDTEAVLQDTMAAPDDATSPDAGAVATQPARKPQGLFAAVFGSNARPAKAEAAVARPGADAQPLIVEAALTRPAAAKSDIPYGAVLPYGRVARICGLSKKQMGKKIAQYPERRPVYQLYDSAPQSTDPRSFYLTGFGDGCARQFTAALAVFGSVGMHELLRYGLPAEVQPYSDTDKAYERLKRKICGKPKRKPCGAKVGLLEKDTVFLSVYERFEGNAQWMNLLLHRGDVVAQDNKKAGSS